MLSQCWVRSGELALAAVAYYPELLRYKAGAVLISGFSQPMCDNDFFMAKLARRLAREGLYVLQVDPRGHGDSPGNLEEVTLGALREDLHSAIQFAKEQAGGKIFGIGRGLSALLLGEPDLHPELWAAAGIAPYCLAPEAVCQLFPEIGPGVVDTALILTGNDFKRFSDFNPEAMAFFDALGAGLLLNLVGQKISGRLLVELKSYEPVQVLRANPETRFWLTPDRMAPDGMVTCAPKQARSLRDYQDNPFPANPLWHHRAIESIRAWVIQQSGEYEG
jgi:pimeloyl-ACP methyl ester carboxylesterase